MKSLKAAAVVAGSVALVGAAAPAFAYNAADVTPTSLNGAVSQLAKGPVTLHDAMPLQHQSDALNTENKGSLLNTVKGATTALNQRSPMLGGLPLQG
ncbi:hypothetical protein [Streptomyces sp. MMG1121]|uniref:hypothetical protein n=1 Tax=Streptomyces sp. MMG1121 TaxID=1415544 RepID=UPI0006AE19B1|nr:hypothetical protein [Streptomyces sp. MMG1121]KOV58319.1 hypothetical protein ADK64_36375 [Streptomyces sp. MMG1121]